MVTMETKAFQKLRFWNTNNVHECAVCITLIQHNIYLKVILRIPPSRIPEKHCVVILVPCWCFYPNKSSLAGILIGFNVPSQHKAVVIFFTNNRSLCFQPYVYYWISTSVFDLLSYTAASIAKQDGWKMPHMNQALFHIVGLILQFVVEHFHFLTGGAFAQVAYV